MSMTPDSGGTATGQAQQELERAKGEAGHIASEAAEAARDRGREQLDSIKHRTADRAEELADAIDSTASDLESGDSGAAVSGYGHSMAEMMRRFAGGLREQEIEDFASELAGFARRSPASFLAGSVALGFGVSRFLKATSQRPAEHYGSDRWADDEDDFDEEYLFDEEQELDTTLEPSASPEVSSYAAGEPWPEDRGNERPGASSQTQHTSPAIGDPPRSEYKSGATSEPAAQRSNLEGDAERRDISGGPDRE
jgi:vacuolar-type H+-ATPase subunit H